MTPFEKRLVFILLLGLFFLAGLVVESKERKYHSISENLSSAKVSKSESVTFPLDVNTASKEQLIKVPGIGPVKASAIVAYREEHGPFDSLEKLLRVPGIGEKTLERIRPYLRVSGVEKAGALSNSLKDDSRSSRKININTASLKELISLPGIGEVKAKRIMEYRPFSQPEDLLKVPGIGERTLEKIKDMIEF